jgi:hypothetical protein
MKRLMANRKQKKAILIALAAPLMFSPAPLMADRNLRACSSYRPAGANDRQCAADQPDYGRCCVLQQSTDDIRFLWR